MLETVPNAPSLLHLDLMNGRPLYVRGRDEPVYIRLQIPNMPQLPALMRNSIFRFNELSVLWAALHLINDERRVLISVAQEPEQTMRWFKEALELQHWQGVVHFQLPQDEDQLARFQETRLVCVDYCGANSYEVALLNRGIATSHGQMPQRLRRLMTDLIARGICPITVATATLTEGVNLPFDIIFLTALKRTSFDPTGPRYISSPLSISEFNNLAGRAGRPNATKGMEGMTLVAVPQRPSTTALNQIDTQRRQLVGLQREYNSLRHDLLAAETEGEDINSPLSLLLNSIKERTFDLFGFESEQFLEWLEAAIPVEISEDAGKGMISEHARLADSVDELDGFLLSALEQISLIQNRALQGEEAEAFLVGLWQSTFTAVAAAQETWLEQAFIRRGRAVIENIYPDPDERKRLYQYGFPPYIGRRFEQVAPAIRARIQVEVAYGKASSAERLAAFCALGSLLVDDRGFGLRVRDTVTDQTILANWQGVLAWWMQGEDAEGPEPTALRSWQRFVADNLEFRLGVAIGAVIAQAWSAGIEDPLRVPSLASWRETTGLPWFGFWTRELLRWGTLEPFVAFALAQGLARTRTEATGRHLEFQSWLRDRDGNFEAEDMIDPQLFLEWQDGLQSRVSEEPINHNFPAVLTGSSGQRERYHVIPIENRWGVMWIDAAGYELAQSKPQAWPMGNKGIRDDYELHINNGTAVVQLTCTN